jgi:hypothetical protein
MPRVSLELLAHTAWRDGVDPRGGPFQQINADAGGEMIRPWRAPLSMDAREASAQPTRVSYITFAICSTGPGSSLNDRRIASALAISPASLTKSSNINFLI